MNLLIADDDASTSFTLNELINLECQVKSSITNSVKNTLLKIASTKFDVALIDYMFQDGVADDIVFELHKINPDCVIICITGYPMNRLNISHLPVKFWLPKPLCHGELDKLFDIIKQINIKKDTCFGTAPAI